MIYAVIASLIALFALFTRYLKAADERFKRVFKNELKKMEKWEREGGVWLTLQEKYSGGWRTVRVLQGRLA